MSGLFVTNSNSLIQFPRSPVCAFVSQRCHSAGEQPFNAMGNGGVQ